MCDTAHGDTAVTIHCQSPPSHVDQPSLSRTWAHGDSSLTPLSPPRVHSLLLPSAVDHRPLLTSELYHWPPLFPSEVPRRTVVSAATSSNRSNLAPTALASGMSTSSLMSSPSPTVVCAPPTPSSLQGGPHDLVARLRPHLRHRQHLIRAVTIVHIAVDPLTIASPP
jgi:hypothetical protein